MSIIVNLNVIMTFKEKLKAIIELESNNYDLHKIEILKNVPLWRLIRNEVRTNYLKSETSFNNKSRSSSIEFTLYFNSVLKIDQFHLLVYLLVCCLVTCILVG